MRQPMRRFAPLLFLGLAACGARTGPQEAQPATVLEVDNQHSLDMNIYVVRTSGARERLGTATAHTRSRLTIPARLIFGLTPLRFMADPIGGRATPVTQEITVQPGDTVVLQIPPG
jgi:hypothetical protein